MSNKAIFRSAVGTKLNEQGYRNAGLDNFEKRGEFYTYQVRLSFVGRAIIQSEIILGFRLSQIDHALSALPSMHQHMAASDKSTPTIFSSLKNIADSMGIETPRVINLESDWRADIDQCIDAIRIIEEKVSTIDKLADLVLAQRNLPAGHHAFRVPLLLSIARRNDEVSSYIVRVASTGFIQGYEENMTKLLKLVHNH